MTKIVTVLGARPQFIKASVVTAILLRQRGVHELTGRTGQYIGFSKSNVFCRELDTAELAY